MRILKIVAFKHCLISTNETHKRCPSLIPFKYRQEKEKYIACVQHTDIQYTDTQTIATTTKKNSLLILFRPQTSPSSSPGDNRSASLEKKSDRFQWVSFLEEDEAAHFCSGIVFAPARNNDTLPDNYYYPRTPGCRHTLNPVDFQEASPSRDAWRQKCCSVSSVWRREHGLLRPLSSPRRRCSRSSEMDDNRQQPRYPHASEGGYDHTGISGEKWEYMERDEVQVTGCVHRRAALVFVVPRAFWRGRTH